MLCWKIDAIFTKWNVQPFPFTTANLPVIIFLFNITHEFIIENYDEFCIDLVNNADKLCPDS